MDPTTPADDISFRCVQQCIEQICTPKPTENSTFWIIYFIAMFIMFILIPIGLGIYCTVKHCRKSKKDKRNAEEDREKCHTWSTPSFYSEPNSK
ncbi:hypothetical protein DdX_05199 [Ditylenchus destructor]|uniref:Uncharacterized protein n=1 Tax=Ditylenchus destructor TaxID=166010 RepID=A0AAD4N7P0_9BILA|nr:hypothetical protein DdX_05199 [Ditylenchus destructor]